MAFITNATRKVVIDHVVATLGRAPTTKELADVTVLLNDGASLADVAGYLTSSEGYLAKYPLGQTAKEVGADILDASIVGGVLAADIRLAAIDIIAGGLTAGTYTIASATNAVVAFLSNTANNANTDLGDIAKAFQNRTAAAEEFTTTFTLEGVTVTEADLAAAVEGVTSDATTLAAAKAAFAAGNKSIAEQAAADKVAADAAAAKAAEEKAAADAKAAEEKAAADKAAADKAAADKATADAAAAEKVLTDAADAAANAAATAIEAAEAADAELATAKTASEAAATKAALTEATALTAVTTTATTADTAAKAAVVTAQTAYDAALVAGVAVDVSTANGELLIAQNNASVAAAALVTATAASDAATADDAAAATAATAYETALEAASTAGEAAETAAAAAATAAAATADTDDDTAAAAQVTEAAAATPTANAIAADAKAAADKAAADAAAAKAAEDKAAADKAAADKAAADKAAADAAAAKAVADKAAADAQAAIEAEAARVEKSLVVNLTVNGDAGAAATTGVGDDTFNGALVGAGTTGTTIQAGDSLAGGTGTDKLNISATGAAGTYSLLGVQTSSIETVSLNDFTDAGIVTVDAVLMPGVEKVRLNSSGADGDVAFSNLDRIVSAEMANGSGDLSLAFQAAAVVGKTDATSLSVSNVTAGTFAQTGVETLTLSSSLTPNVLTAVTGMTTLNINAASNLTIGTALANTVTTVDATGSTGKVTLGVTAGGNVKVTGGDGADTIDMAGGLTKLDVIDGGDGIDTVKIDIADTGAADATAATQAFTGFQLTNVESVSASIADDSGGTAIDVTALNANLTLTAATTNTDVTVNKIGTQVVTVVNNSASTLELGDVAVNLADGTGLADSMSVSLVAATNADQTLDLLTVDANAETANIAVSGATGTGKELTLTSLIADGAKTINITGSGNLITQLNETGTNATTLIDASTATGVLAITENVGNKITIKGSQGQNTINMGTGLLNTDTIIGGASTKDAVTATVGTAQTATTGVLNLTDVETLSLTHTSGQSATIDLTSSTGVAAIAVTGSAANATGTLTLKGLANGTTVATQDTNSFDGTLALALADATGTADSLTLSVTSATGSDDDFAITGTGIETLAISAGATDAQTTDIDASGFAASSITISGGTAASNMFLGGATLNKSVTSVDASGFAGDVTLDASGALSTGVDFKLGNLNITNTTGDAVTGSASTTTEDSLSGTFAASDTTAEFTQFAGIENYTLTINDAVDITAATNDGIGDGDAVVKTITFTGGNSASSYTAADAIDGAKLTSFDASGFNGTMSVNIAGSIMKNVTMKAGGTALDSLVYSGVNGLSSAAAVGTGVAKASGYESVAFRTATAASSIDMSGVTGATFVGVQGDQNLTLSKLAAGVVVGVGESQAQDNYSGTLTAALADATGSADSLTFKLANQAADNQIDAKLVTSGIETVTISHTATAGQNDADLDVSGITAGTLVITGGSVAEDLDLTNGDTSTLNAATAIVNASANASILHVTASTNTSTAFTAAGSNVDLIGSVVADSFTIGTAAAGISAAITAIDGGTGSDTLVVNSKAGGSLVNVEAVENITVNVVGLTGTTSTVTIAASSKGANDASLVTLTGGLAGNTTTFAGDITDHAVTIDGSTFVGNMGLTFGDDALIQTNLADPITIKGGSGTKDTVTVSASNSDTGAFTMSGIETLVFGNDTGASVLQLVNVTGLGTIVLTDDATTATAVSITTYTDQMINLGVTGGAGFDNTSVTVAKTAMTGTADVVNFTAAETDETTNAVTLAVDGFETVNLALANDASALTGDDHKIAITNTNTNAVTLNVTGTDTLADLTLSAIADSITTIAAGGVAGSITMAARSSTGAMTITTGAGNDTVLMKNANDVLDGGTKAVTGDSDTLTVSGALVLGGIQVDLSSATDQVTTYNGVTNSAVQKNFESVDLSGVTGFGSVIQAGTAGSTITGTGLTDQITGGTKADTVNVTAGNDIVALGGGNDTVFFTEALFINNSATTATHDGGTGTNTIQLEAASINIVDADFARLTNFQELKLTSSTNNVTIGTAAATTGIVTVTGGAGADTIVAAAGAQTINAGAGADVITGGAGADAINVGAGDATGDKVINTAVGDSGTFALNAGAVNSISTTGMDIVTGFAAGDTLNLALYTSAPAAAAADGKIVSTVVTQLTSVVAGGTIVGANEVGTVRGTFDATSSTFVGAGAGTDLLVTYDADASLATTALESIVLVGGGALTMSITAAAGGELTFA